MPPRGDNCYVSNETGCLAKEYSRCLQMVAFGFEHISFEPELSLTIYDTVSSG